MSPLKIDKIKFLKRTILVLLLLACVGIFVAHKFVRRYGFEGIGDFISVYRHNQALADAIEPQELQLLVADKDYDFLKKRRDEAIERGIQINDGEDNYVACKIVQNGDTIKGEMRLKGHMTDHLQGEKWSFRVKTKKKPVFGMTRFSLQEPGTRNYAYEWIYHQLLKEEGVIHLNYDFIHLKLNEKDLGIYALEEHFGQHVLEHNDRPAGAILRWNPNLYWEWRIDELQGTYLDEQYSSYASSFVEPYEKGTVEDDPILVETYTKGAALLESFRRGEKKTSEIFDVEKMARFHAIIDLVGGHHSLDWSDVKFFYNSKTGKIEPVGYESFSVRKTESVAGQRIPDTYDGEQFNYHNQLFSDPVFFAAYIAELERICNEEYLHAFITKIQPELDKKLGVLAHEFPYRKFTFDPYFENIELIRHNLELPKPFHAFLEEQNDSLVKISVTPVSDFPIEILSLTVDGKDEYELDSIVVLPAKARNTYAHYFMLDIPHDAKKIKNLKLKARIPGSSHIFEAEVSDLPSYNDAAMEFTVYGSMHAASENNWINLNDSVSCFNTKDIVFDRTVLISDTNHTLVFFPGQRVTFLPGSKLITAGTVEMTGGSEDGEEIIVSVATQDETTTKTAPYRPDEAILINNGNLKCTNVQFVNANELIYASGSDIRFNQCLFADTDSSFMRASLSEIEMTDCASGKLNCLGNFDRCMVRIKSMTAKNGTVFLHAFGSDIDLVKCDLRGFETIADLRYSSSLSAWATILAAEKSIATLEQASSIKMFSGEIKDASTAVVKDISQLFPGESTYQFYKTVQTNINRLENTK